MLTDLCCYEGRLWYTTLIQPRLLPVEPQHNESAHSKPASLLQFNWINNLSGRLFLIGLAASNTGKGGYSSLCKASCSDTIIVRSRVCSVCVCVLPLDKLIVFLQYWGISSLINADYAKQSAALIGTPWFNFTLTIKVSCVQGVLWPHRIWRDERHSGGREDGERGRGNEVGRIMRWREFKRKTEEGRNFFISLSQFPPAALILGNLTGAGLSANQTPSTQVSLPS